MAGEGGKSDAPIIIKKGKKGHGGHHGGAWKVAYADFVTAMMALFIVLWILSQGNEVREQVANYFKDPISFGTGQGVGVVGGKEKMVPGIKTDGETDEKIRLEQEKIKLEKASAEIIEDIKQNPEFAEVAKFVTMEITPEGLRIELLESSNEVFFEIGTSHLNLKALNLLKAMGEQFGKLNNKVVIEGHTDAHPFQNGSTGYTNYELSADRANSARRALQAGGLQEANITEIRGYADKKLKNPSDPFDLVNRRISIIVKYPGAQ